MILRVPPEDLRRHASIAGNYSKIRSSTRREDGGDFPSGHIPLVVCAAGIIRASWSSQDLEYRLGMEDYDLAKRSRDGVVRVDISIQEAFDIATVVELYTNIVKITRSLPDTVTDGPIVIAKRPICYLHWWEDQERFVAEFLDFKPTGEHE